MDSTAPYRDAVLARIGQSRLVAKRYPAMVRRGLRFESGRGLLKRLCKQCVPAECVQPFVPGRARPLAWASIKVAENLPLFAAVSRATLGGESKT
jgi:hypothetical protein